MNEYKYRDLSLTNIKKFIKECNKSSSDWIYNTKFVYFDELAQLCEAAAEKPLSTKDCWKLMIATIIKNA